MFKKTIHFENLDGESVSKDFYFHMSKTELLGMAAEGEEVINRINRIISTKDAKGIINEFRELIKLSVGIRSPDGTQFSKSPEAQAQLLDSPAFDELLLELCTNAGASSEFVRQLIPEKMQQQFLDQIKAAEGNTLDPFKEPSDPRPVWEREHRRPTDAELQAMDRDELVRAMARLNSGM